METLVLKTLEKSKGVHPKSGNFNIRLIARGDKSGTIDIVLSQYPIVTSTVTIQGGVFVVNGVDQTTATLTSTLTVRVRLTSEDAFISIKTTTNISFNELNPLTAQTVNSPIIDYSFPMYPMLYSIANMFKGYSTFNRSVRGLSINNASINVQLQLVSTWEGASIFNQPVNSIDTTYVRNFSNVFKDAYAFNQSVSNWKTSNAIQMNGMFSSAYSFNQPVSHFDVKKVITFDNMFYNAKSFNQDLSNWEFNLNATLSDWLTGTALTPSNYSKVLQRLAEKDWKGRTAQKIMYARNLKYNSDGAIARATLVSGGWTILDSGQE